MLQEARLSVVLAALLSERQEWSLKLVAMIDAEQDKLRLPFMPNGQSFHLGKRMSG